MHFMKLMLIDEFNIYRPAAPVEFVDVEEIVKLLNSFSLSISWIFLRLNESFAIVCVQLLLINSVPLVSRTFSLLLQEE